MIEVRHLQALIALSETGNLSKAARRLHLSQPALSQQIKAVESYLGVEIFQRKSTPLRLSPAGQRLLTTASQVIKSLQTCERDLLRIAEGRSGQLRIAVECHSCFDWLMPAMDRFREAWPEVEMDLVSGFQPDPTGLLLENQADLVIVSKAPVRRDVVYQPLFRYEVFALLAHGHPLARRKFLTAQDFAGETLITYPIPDDRIDIIREVLGPAGVNPSRRTAMLTVAILQLVASGRGLAAMPAWAVQPYLDRNYIAHRPVRRSRLYARLYAATTRSLARSVCMEEFIATMKEVSFGSLKGISPSDEE